MPSPWIVVAIGWLLTVAVGAGGTLWYRADYERALADGAAYKTEMAEAVARQEQQDRALSASLLAEQKQRLDTLHAQALSDLKVVSNAPVTKDCGPVLRAASRSVRQLIAGTAPDGTPGRP